MASCLHFAISWPCARGWSFVAVTSKLVVHKQPYPHDVCSVGGGVLGGVGVCVWGGGRGGGDSYWYRNRAKQKKLATQFIYTSHAEQTAVRLLSESQELRNQLPLIWALIIHVKDIWAGGNVWILNSLHGNKGALTLYIQ